MGSLRSTPSDSWLAASGITNILLNDALREVHEDCLELLVHAADLCELEELGLVSLLYFVQGDKQED